MEILLSIVIVLLIVNCLASFYVLKQHTQKIKGIIEQERLQLSKSLYILSQKQDKLQKSFDGLFTVDPAAPNEVTQKENGETPITEDNPLNISKGFKIEVEGGDTAFSPDFR